MMKYGLPYKGSKSKIAKDILTVLPAGRRLVDLFGGGFAITDCALRNFPDKWEYFYYNDKDPLLAPLIQDCIDGKYSEDNFHPVWISKDDFFKHKDKDGYIKLCWSFGADGRTYAYSDQTAELKRKAFNFIVDGTPSDITEGISLHGKTIHDRRLDFQRQIRNKNDLYDASRIQSLEHLHCLTELESLSRLESLERYQTLSRLELHCSDYHDYEYQDGDVVYCDIPYQDSKKADTDYGGFDWKEFYLWAASRPYPVYYSSYTKGSVLWSKAVNSSIGAHNSATRYEALLAL